MATMRAVQATQVEATSARLASAVRDTFEGISRSFEAKFKQLHSNGYGESRSKELELFQAGSTLYGIMRKNCGITINDPTITDPSARMLLSLGMKGAIVERIDEYLKDFEANAKGNIGSAGYMNTLARFESMVMGSLATMDAASSAIKRAKDHKKIMEGVCIISDEIDSLQARMNSFRHETVKPAKREGLVLLLRPNVASERNPNLDSAA
ncbi:MAG: hypothetical protein KGH69_04305 [Candidatus Micrarchaeota archaeon]|nr:hypothetical protein [Candidatus Micrarchaeota archaeon]